MTTLHEVEESLRGLDADVLREMAYQTAHSHVTVCELTSRIGDCAHIGADEIRDRIGELTPNQLAAILAPPAWLSVQVHRELVR